MKMSFLHEVIARDLSCKPFSRSCTPKVNKAGKVKSIKMANLLATTFCNLCFNSQVEGKQTFFITSCSHVFCSACLTNHPSFCRLCNNQCKVLEVNEQMPSEVKMFFEDSSIQRMIQSVEKINSFQENQVSIYINSCSKYQTKYHNNKKNAKSLLKTKNEVLESLKREKEIMETLKNAYK